MSAARVKAAGVPFICAALIGACDRSSPESSPDPDPPSPAGGAVKAADAACRLPLGHFTPSLRNLVGSALDYPYNRVVIDQDGRILWNSVPAEPQLLREYIGTAAAADPPIFLLVNPNKEAHCAVVQETLAAAVRIGRCSPQRCAFEWPPGNPPPPPLLPERSKLLGKWILDSINDAAPPRYAPPIEVTFTNGAVSARSQCVTYDWMISEEEGRLRLHAPPGPVDTCFRLTSEWEDRFGAAMAAASYVESVSGGLIVTGPKGTLKLKRQD